MGVKIYKNRQKTELKLKSRTDNRERNSVSQQYCFYWDLRVSSLRKPRDIKNFHTQLIWSVDKKMFPIIGSDKN